MRALRPANSALLKIRGFADRWTKASVTLVRARASTGDVGQRCAHYSDIFGETQGGGYGSYAALAYKLLRLRLERQATARL